MRRLREHAAFTSGNYIQRTVIIAVVAMRMVQVSINEIVDMAAVRDGFVAASGTVLVIGIVTVAAMIGRARIRIFRRHFDYVLIDVIAMRVMQMPVMQIIDMIIVAHRSVPAIRAVLMRMIIMLRV